MIFRLLSYGIISWLLCINILLHIDMVKFSELQSAIIGGSIGLFFSILTILIASTVNELLDD